MGKTYLVTGGAGFAGFTVLKLLTTSCSTDVDHVKVLDLGFSQGLVDEIEARAKDALYRRLLLFDRRMSLDSLTGIHGCILFGYKEVKNAAGVSLEWIKGDLTKPEDVKAAADGCDTVLHIAGIVPGGLNSDEVTMWNVNVGGTRNVVSACSQTGVTALVYVSTMYAVGPNLNAEAAVNLDEDTYYNSHPRIWYGQTKKKAEECVLEANGRMNKHGKTLRTCSLRPASVYGENYRLLKELYHFSNWNKTIVSFLSSEARLDNIYVGNLAWAIIESARQIRAKADLMGGQAYFVTDDTPVIQVYDLYAKLFSPLGYKVSRKPFVPFWLVYILYFMMEMLFHVLRFFGFTKQRMTPRSVIRTMNTKFTLSGQKFVKHLGCKPPFTFETSVANSGRFIKKLAETDFAAPYYDYELKFE